LQKGQPYRIEFGNEEVAAPSYDLAFFKDTIPQQLPVIIPTGIKALAGPAKAPATVFTDKNIIWVAIILVIGLLGFMSYKMLQETGKKTE
jgi:hypothetical protein